MDGDPYLMIECNFVAGQGPGPTSASSDPQHGHRPDVQKRRFPGSRRRPRNPGPVLYRQGDMFVFMDNRLRAIRTWARPGRQAWKYFKESMVCSMLLHNNNPIPPNHVVLRVEYTNRPCGATRHQRDQARQDGDCCRDHRPQFRGDRRDDPDRHANRRIHRAREGMTCRAASLPGPKRDASTAP